MAIYQVAGRTQNNGGLARDINETDILLGGVLKV